tara:strand:- start:853 stop:1074 length:222 start_codon:yes stop_codon:yes gene_type:complete
MYNIVTYVARMGEKMVYEVFNMLTGQWEEAMPERDVLEALDVYLTDYETYQAEKEIITEIIRQKRASINQEMD